MPSRVETVPDDYDLQRGWDDVLAAFAKASKIELQPDSVLTPEDVIAQLKSKRDKDEADQAKYRVVKDVLGKTLSCIQTLGGIAASGASMVFGPANLCYAGLSYLITAGQNYSNIFRSLEVLLKQMSDVMERMVIYLEMKSVDKPLRKIIHELLQNIVSICGLSIKVLHGNKILKFLKVFAFNEDDGVKGALGSLKALVDRESQMKTTLTYAIVKEGFSDTSEAIAGINSAVDAGFNDTTHAVSGVRSVVDKLADDSQKREVENAERTQMDKIRSVLGVQKMADKQSELHTRLWSETVHDTGQWLQDEESYKAWADHTTNFNKIMFLSADEGYGKTFLTTSAVHALQKRYNRPVESATRTMIAYYHLLPKDSKATHGFDDDSFSVDKVLKTIALQFAQDPVYRKDLVGLCDKWTEPEGIEELFTRLVDPCYKSNEVFYMMIDGIELADERQLSGLSQLLKGITTRITPEQQSHVRFLFCGRVSTVKDLVKDLRYPNVVIDVASNNGPDIEKFTHDRLATLKLLQGESEQIRALRQEVFDVLTKEAHGDFINIDLLLKEIATKQWPAEVREVLTKMKEGADRTDTIAREIARCNDTLSPQEVRDLNTMLIWVLAAKTPLKVSALNSVLFFQNNESSLRPLQDRIREKYSSFFHLDQTAGNEGEAGYLVSLVSDSIREYFKSTQTSALEAQEDGTISEPEIKIVRRFLNSVCDQDLYAKFGFDEFFAQKINSTTVMIDVDLERAPSTLLLGCLQALVSDAPDMETLWLYAVDNWTAHLADIDLAMTDPLVKTNIGKHLVELFTDEDTVSKWWTTTSVVVRRWWFYVDTNVDNLLNWFRDTAVTKSYSDTHKAWVKSLTSNSNPDADVLEHVVKYLCKAVYQINPKNWPDMGFAFSAIAGYRSKIMRRTNSSVARRETDVDKDEVSSDDIVEVSIWVSKLLGIDTETDYHWNRAVGRALRIYLKLDESIKWYKKAIALKDDAYVAETGLASALADNGDPQGAIDIGEKLREQLESRGSTDVDDVEEAKAQIRNALASWYRRVERFDEALAIFDERLTQYPEAYWLLYEKLLLYEAMGSYQKMFDMLEELSSQQDSATGISRRNRLWHMQAFVNEFYDKLKDAAAKSDNTQQLLAMMREAIQETSNPQYVPLAEQWKAFVRTVITYIADEIAWTVAKTEKEKQAVVESWERNLHDAVDATLDFIKVLIGKRLAAVYVDRLRGLAPGVVDQQATLKKLSDLAYDGAERDDSANTSLLMARYEDSNGSKDNVKKLTRGSVKIGLDLLSDDDPDNDWQGYQRLANALMFAGDDDNALAAWSLLGPNPAQELQTQDAATSEDGPETVNGDTPVNGSSKADSAGVNGVPPANGDIKPVIVPGNTTSKRVEVPDDTTTERAVTADNIVVETNALVGRIAMLCDGDCDPLTAWTYANNMYACKDCLDTMFDESCMTRLKAGEMSINVCNPKHEFLHVPEWDFNEARQRGKDVVLLRGEKLPVADWLNLLRKDWDFEQVDKTDTAKGEETVNGSDEVKTETKITGARAGAVDAAVFAADRGSSD